MRHQPILCAVAAAAMLAGCANMTDTQRHTATGAGIGALGGAALGAVTGGSVGTGAVIGAGVGALGGYIWSQHMEEQKRDMQMATQGTGVAVTQTADNRLKLDIPSDISFATGRSDIQPNFRPVLERLARSLRANPGTEVLIIGHTDSTGSDAINDPLSLQRATSTRNFLADRGVNPMRVQVDGRGSYEPIASNDSAEGRARNRRVEIYVGERQRG
ncbi:OmpA family protein [Comamonas flocculans]|uniref:OmpA family protein n=1 Tax=Comamonas flocculans TaxID=2597701 RepID=A0A5B8RVE4_9BURK|nr:OmpA family protein [Comamonas flocculans]QEA12722.1 OmpA family protein [Comamonas flocculans]